MRSRRPKATGLLDVYVGQWLRVLRMAVGMSREELAARSHLTFQQIQKYESGRNRISAGRLAELASILGVSPADFFVGADVLRTVFARREGDQSSDPNFERDVCDLLIAYLQTGSEEGRRSILELVKSTSQRQLKDRGSAVFVVRPGAARPTGPVRTADNRQLSAMLATLSARLPLSRAA